MGNAIELFKVLSDQSRLNIIQLLLKEDMYVELIANTLNLTPSTVSFHLKKLEKVNLVTSRKDQYYTVYKLNKEILNQSVSTMVSEEKREVVVQQKRQDDYRTKVLDTFLDGSILKSIPVQRKKRVIILEELSKSFEMNKEYLEKEVNEIIKKHHEDFCTLRREFIIERLFTRENNVYKRVK